MTATNQTITETYHPSDRGKFRRNEEDFLRDENLNPDLIMIAIRRKYADAIKAGTKTVEVRRRFNEQLLACYAVVYVPGEKVLANLLRIEHIWKDRPQEIWEKYADRLGMEWEAFEWYTRNHWQVAAVEVESLNIWSDDIPFEDVGQRGIPQNYRYMMWDECALLDSMLIGKTRLLRNSHPVFIPPERRRRRAEMLR